MYRLSRDSYYHHIERIFEIRSAVSTNSEFENSSTHFTFHNFGKRKKNILRSIYLLKLTAMSIIKFLTLTISKTAFFFSLVHPLGDMGIDIKSRVYWTRDCHYPFLPIILIPVRQFQRLPVSYSNMFLFCDFYFSIFIL